MERFWWKQTLGRKRKEPFSRFVLSTSSSFLPLRVQDVLADGYRNAQFLADGSKGYREPVTTSPSTDASYIFKILGN